ncbi:MAG: N-6 DNA methylase [Spirochaetes bacterium]|nr:N-6 DNA methylase [Spirochaetota bacterium]
MNERKTESIVRTHFEQYKEILNIEEQTSDNPKIDKLLKVGSKKGSGKGRPEFIISFSGNSELLLVIECKADITKHESSNKDKYSEYAVDGALLYSLYLSKDYDVIAIAVSGQTKQKLNISHFLQLKGEQKAVQIFGKKLLAAEDYLSGYLKSPEKFKQDYNTLLDFTKKINETLHGYKILESQRSLLISCILIALENKAFVAAYPLFGSTNPNDSIDEKKKKTDNAAKELANYLVDTVTNELKNANIQPEKIDNLGIQFGFIRTDTSLSSKKDVLKNIIKDIDTNINSFIKTHEYFDVLGQLYVEFLRYANSDKGLGIVLTPPHITDFFADLAQVNKNSIVYDNCAGTGGFLISAMKKMIEDAKGDEKKIKEIKKNSLYGVEYQAHIFALAVSNMYIHQDGKTNIYKGNCFDDDIMSEIKSKKPTVGFLNPPYKADKKNDVDELEFVLNNLECLVDGALCITIVPMSCSLSVTGRGYELKKRLMEKHTLEAVLSMPNDLFIDSNVGTVTCIMIFRAHQPHSIRKKTFFGYFKHDGYEKRRKGRIDINNQWEVIKSDWLSAFQNKEDIPNLSINYIVKPDEEWCPEAYLSTDFTKIKREDFISNLKDHCIYLFNNGLSDEISIASIKNTKLHLDFNSWERYKVKSFFNIYSGSDKPKQDDSKHWNGETVNSIENQTTNNGISEKIEYADADKIFSNFISVVSIGEGGKAFYQPERGACFTRVKALIPLHEYQDEFNKYVFLFFCSLLDMERYRYGYGRVLSKDRLGETELLLPTKNNKPDFKYMEEFIKTLPYSSSV